MRDINSIELFGYMRTLEEGYHFLKESSQGQSHNPSLILQ